jgi:hypothetical protein
MVPPISMKHPLRVMASSTLDRLVYRLEVLYILTALIVVGWKDTMISRLEMYPEKVGREFSLAGY